MSRQMYWDEEAHQLFPVDDVPQEPVKPTNADRIRSMSDEKLASLFGSTCDCDNASCFINHKVSCLNGCESAWLEWLKREVDDA